MNKRKELLYKYLDAVVSEYYDGEMQVEYMFQIELEKYFSKDTLVEVCEVLNDKYHELWHEKEMAYFCVKTKERGE